MSVVEYKHTASVESGERMPWTAPKLDEVSMRATEIGKSGDIPECVFAFGPDIPTDPLCNVLS